MEGNGRCEGHGSEEASRRKGMMVVAVTVPCQLQTEHILLLFSETTLQQFVIRMSGSGVRGASNILVAVAWTPAVIVLLALADTLKYTTRQVRKP